MKRPALFLCALLAGCGAPADRLTDEEAAAGQNATIEETVPIDIPEPVNSPPVEAPVPAYQALGTEPGWTLSVTPKTITYEGDYGSVTITETTPKRFRPAPGTYAGTRLTVTIAATECSDGMSERTYRHTVTVIADGKSVSGCGGGTVITRKKPEPANEPIANTA